MSLTPEALARLTKLHLRTRVVVDGLLAGISGFPPVTSTVTATMTTSVIIQPNT